jgi:hypothetical protein
VTAQIKKSEKNLLEKLFSVIHHLTPDQMQALLKEDDAVVERRAHARKALDDVKMAVYQVGGKSGSVHELKRRSAEPCIHLLCGDKGLSFSIS